MEVLAAIPTVWFWVIIAVALAVGEMLVNTFFMLPFAIGSAAAAIASLLGIGFAWQVLILAVVGVVCLILLRPFARKVTESSEPQRAVIDRFIDAKGVVLVDIDPHAPGIVRVGGEEWSAKSADPHVGISAGTGVDVITVDGTYLVVEPTAGCDCANAGGHDSHQA